VRDLEVVDVLNTPGGMEPLLRLGVRRVPCVVVGERYVFAQNLDDVAAFLGIPVTRSVLPPETLVAKYLEILPAAGRLILQIPAERMDDRVVPNRPRTLRPFAYHIFRIAESYLIAYEGAELSEGLATAEPPQGVGSTRDIVAYGEKVAARLARWWETTADKGCRKSINTYYGIQTALDVLERCTWHSAQHCRQLAAVLERFGITPDRPLTPELLAGLPLPEGLWE
jgi:hypothetical protein